MKRFISVCFVLLCLATVSGFGASSGVIDCQEKSSVTALDGPNSIVAVRQLHCNQTISIIGMEQGYVKIQIAEHLTGFVEARYVQTTEDSVVSEPWTQTEAEPDSQTQTAVVSNQSSYSMIDQITGEVRAPQSTEPIHSIYRGYPQLEIFAGYNMQKIDRYPMADFWKEGTLASGYTATDSDYLKKGFSGSFTYNFTPRLGLEAAIRYSVGNILNYSKNDSKTYDLFSCDFKREDLSFLVGPHFKFRKGNNLTPFVHALAGYSGDKFSVNREWTINGEFFSHNNEVRTSKSFGALAGGGLDLSINDNWAVRLVQADYYISLHDDPLESLYFVDTGETLYSPSEKKLFKNIAFSFGIVFRFGK